MESLGDLLASPSFCIALFRISTADPKVWAALDLDPNYRFTMTAFMLHNYRNNSMTTQKVKSEEGQGGFMATFQKEPKPAYGVTLVAHSNCVDGGRGVEAHVRIISRQGSSLRV